MTRWSCLLSVSLVGLAAFERHGDLASTAHPPRSCPSSHPSELRPSPSSYPLLTPVHHGQFCIPSMSGVDRPSSGGGSELTTLFVRLAKQGQTLSEPGSFASLFSVASRADSILPCEYELTLRLSFFPCCFVSSFVLLVCSVVSLLG